MIENDAVNVTAYVRIYKDPTGVLWHNFIKLVHARSRMISAKLIKVTIPRRRLRWWASRTKGQLAISTRSFSHCILQMRFVRCVSPPFMLRIVVENSRLCTRYPRKKRQIERQLIVLGHYKGYSIVYRPTMTRSRPKSSPHPLDGKPSTSSSSRTSKSCRVY